MRHLKPPVILAVPAALMLIATLGARAVVGVEQQRPAPVVIKDFRFTPMSLTVKAGTTVVWTNRDDEPHTVVSASGLFRSGAIDTDGTFNFRFDRPGTYRFTCSIHPQMVGTVVVR